MMITWGAYTQAGGYWKGVYEGGYSEWLKFRQIPNIEYDSLIREFNPVDFNATEWVKIAKDAGMKYMVMMAKHHDGFALYDSKVSKYDIVDMTRFKRDPVAELAAACQKAGLKFGVYYSVDRDWHHPDAACDGRYNQCNFWDYPQNKAADAMDRWHNNYFPNYAYKQVEELVTRYPIDILWFDGIGLKTRKEVAKLDSLIHTVRPLCLINSRISNFVGSTDADYGSKGDNETPGGYQAGGWENPGTLGFSYGYSVHDSLMSPKQAVHNLIEIVSKGGNYLLNVGPNGKGVIIPEATSILSQMGSWLNKYGSSIYGADGLPVNPPENIRLTVKPHQLFVHVLNWTDQSVILKDVIQVAGKNLNAITNVYMLADPAKRPLKHQVANGVLTIDLASCPFSASVRNKYAEVIVVTDATDNALNPMPYSGWKYSGSFNILTTPEGADLHVSALVKDFPLLLRLDKGTFNFEQAGKGGEDVRFTTVSGKALAYQIESWDAKKSTANIWIRIPEIKGNTRQEIKMYWGKSGAKSESDGKAVFSESNGYLAVLHMNDGLKDEAGSLIPVNAGTTGTDGMIGTARHLNEGQGINCGEKITNFPTGATESTTETWIRPNQPNGLVMGWGNEGKTEKVTMTFASPPQMRIDCYWSGANVNGSPGLPLNQWIQVVHTYMEGDSRVYVNGKLDAASAVVKSPLAIKSPARMYIGGWYNDYWFSGDIDETRISKVARSADWIRLQFENQKQVQTLVGPLVQPGNVFSVSVPKIEVAEGKSITVNAQAGGAIKLYWIIKRDGAETVVAADRLSYTLDAGRVVADQAFSLLLKAVYPDTVRTIIIPVTISERIPEPVFTLRAPSAWNGRDTIEVLPQLSNLAVMKSAGAGTLNYKWKVSGGAVIKKQASGKLILLRSQCNGRIMVTLTMNNGGADYSSSIPIMVNEPKSDPWIQRKPGKEEKPVENQFYPRDDKNIGTLYYNGVLDQSADSVFLNIYADGKLYNHQNIKLLKDKRYAFSVKLKPGLIKYRADFGIKTGKTETVLKSAGNLICGDAFIIQGQSNAEATGSNNGPEPDAPVPFNDWIRSYGNSHDGSIRGGWGIAIRSRIWGQPGYGTQQIGSWGMVFANKLVEKYGIPICIMNGAVGGTRVDQHQRNEVNPNDSTTIYGRLLTRIQAAGLTHGIRAILWHQGENNSGAAAPTGDWDYKTYQQYFIDLAACWKQDFPNIQHYYIFQVWPLPCMMGPKDDQLREEQRTLPALFSNMRIMSTLGIVFPTSGKGMCHFDPEGYRQVAQLMSPLVEQDNYGLVPKIDITAPNLRRAWFTGSAKDEIALDFGQPMVWNEEAKINIYLDEEIASISSGSASENVITIRLTGPSFAGKITYLIGKDWAGSAKTLLYGANGIAALTFCSVGIAASADSEPAGIGFVPTMESLRQYEIPEWFEDAKLGIYMHWGPQSIPGVATTWYARWMYEQGSEGYKYHLATYGHPSQFGYKDICRLFTAAKFDQDQADRLVKLYKSAGARYVVPVAVHHDNFDMWDSKYQPRFNSVTTSGKDVVEMWKKATEKEGLHLGVASHVARTYRWLQPSHRSDKTGPLAGVPYDGQNPEYSDLYGAKWDDTSFWYEQRSDVGPAEFEKNFENRMIDLMDKYHPDLYYTDGGIPFQQAGLNVLSHFYNENQKWNNGKLEAVATIKLDWTPNIAVNNYEFGYPDGVQHYQWQSDKTMGADWYWIRNATDKYKSAKEVVHMLMDMVSKNGNLLLNVPLTPDGELENETISLLTDLGKCMDQIGEAVFFTRAWVVADDGGDLRFTRSKENTILYITSLVWPGNELRIKTLGSSRIALESLVNLSMLGSQEKLTYRQDASGLVVKLPATAPWESPAYSFRLTFSGQIPVLNLI
jgi:alpha-L-fucosidase